jgi:hypothetical protein
MQYLIKSQNKNVTDKNTDIIEYNNAHQTKERVISLTFWHQIFFIFLAHSVCKM